MSTVQTDTLIRERVLDLLKRNPSKGFSSVEIHEGLNAEGFRSHIVDVRGALSHLLDVKKIEFNPDRKYQYRTG